MRFARAAPARGAQRPRSHRRRAGRRPAPAPRQHRQRVHREMPPGNAQLETKAVSARVGPRAPRAVFGQRARSGGMAAPPFAEEDRLAPRKRPRRFAVRIGAVSISAFSTPCRPAPAPSKIDAFSWAMPSMLSKAQMRRRDGGDQRHIGARQRASGAISPGWFMPISITAKSVSAASAPASAARPNGCCSCARRHGCGPAAAAARSISLVEVLPTEPVTPHLRAASAPRAAGPAPPAPASTSGTISSGASVGTPSGTRLTSAAAPPPPAPGRRNHARRARPSARRTDRPAASVRCRSRRPWPPSRPAPAARGGCRVGGGPAALMQAPPSSAATATLACSTSSKGKTTSPTICPVSCPLPAISSASPGPSASTPRRIASARSPTSVGLGAPRHHRGADRGGVLAARVVVGHEPRSAFSAAACPISGRLPCRGRRRRRRPRQPAHHMRAQRLAARWPAHRACGRNRRRPRAIGAGAGKLHPPRTVCRRAARRRPRPDRAAQRWHQPAATSTFSPGTRRSGPCT
jgi:hypothetical protein